MSKLPAFQFYPADWLNDIKLQSCSLAAQGLLINMMCLMHQSEKYGYLLVNGANPPLKVLLKLLRFAPDKPQKRFQKWLKELTDYGVLQVTDGGVYYCKRMVKDQDIRDKRKAAGKLGGNPNLVKQEVNQSPNQKSTPSSSSSFSLKKTNKRKILIPDNYKLTEKHIKYANDKKITDGVEDIFEGFCIHHRKVGNKYTSWYAAWQTWVRNKIKWDKEKQDNLNQEGPENFQPSLKDQLS